MTERTNNDAVIELATEAATRKPIVLSDMDGDMGVLAIPLPPEWELETVDTEQWAERPRRSKGTISVHDATGFARAVRQRADVETVALYANEETRQLVAVLNDDDVDQADWRDHRVELQLRPRPEWVHWKRLDGRYVEQEPFAEHIEHGLAELVSPPAADALQIAQTFNATISARFKSGTRLRDGSTQFQYEEDVEASAGLLTIPETLVLRLAPFFGADVVDITARFRFRLKAGTLTLGYLLNRPDEVERAAFASVLTTVAADLGLEPIAGVAPTPR